MVLHVERNRYRVETKVHTKGTQRHATAEDEDICAAIDRFVAKLDYQAITYKEKVVDHHQEGVGLKIRTNT